MFLIITPATKIPYTYDIIISCLSVLTADYNKICLQSQNVDFGFALRIPFCEM